MYIYSIVDPLTKNFVDDRHNTSINEPEERKMH